MTRGATLALGVRWAADLVAFVGGLAFLVLGLTKVMTHREFADAIRSHRIIPAIHVQSVATVASVGETLLGLGVLWLVLLRRRASLALIACAAALMGLCAYGFVLHLYPPPRPVSCGCGFGGLAVESWLFLSVRNGGLAVAACSLAVIYEFVNDLPKPNLASSKSMTKTPQAGFFAESSR